MKTSDREIVPNTLLAIGFIGLFALGVYIASRPCDDMCEISILESKQRIDCYEVDEDGATWARPKCIEDYQIQIAEISTRHD